MFEFELGEKILAIVYGGEGQSLDELRYKRYREQLYKSGSVQKGIDARRLPPTSPSATYHCLRVFHQVQEWLGNNLDPLVYGWENDNGKLSPKAIDVASASDYALKKLKCGCKTNCKKICPCLRVNMNCTEFCQCSDELCENNKNVIKDVDDEIYDENDDILNDFCIF